MIPQCFHLFSQAGDWHFEHKKDGQSYIFVQLIHNVCITYCADKMSAILLRLLLQQVYLGVFVPWSNASVRVLVR